MAQNKILFPTEAKERGEEEGGGGEEEEETSLIMRRINK